MNKIGVNKKKLLTEPFGPADLIFKVYFVSKSSEKISRKKYKFRIIIHLICIFLNERKRLYTSDRFIQILENRERHVVVE